MPERKLCWRISRYCNLHCSHCLAGHANALRRDLSSAEKLAAMHTMIAGEITRITWTGGEPTLCGDLPLLLDLCHQHNIESVVTTHGLALRPHVLAALSPATDRLRFSFDGLEETHNNIRGGPFFSKAIASLVHAASLGFKVEANISVLGANVSEIPELAEILIDRGVSRVVLLTLLWRESAIDNQVVGPSPFEMMGLREAIAHSSVLSTPGLIQLNDYGDPADNYIVVESDGEIMLCSETEGDQSYGSICGEGGEERLRQALNAQTLAHRNYLTA
jgi:MoaA/NifB/PqqE/SkfB family radical SAM enzyme